MRIVLAGSHRANISGGRNSSEIIRRGKIWATIYHGSDISKSGVKKSSRHEMSDAAERYDAVRCMMGHRALDARINRESLY